MKQLYVTLVFVLLFLATNISLCANGIEVKGYKFPVLKLKADNPTIEVKIDNNGNEKLTIKKIVFEIKGKEFINDMHLFAADKPHSFKKKTEIGILDSPSKKACFNLDYSIEGEKYIWLGVTLNEKPTLSDKISFRCLYIETNRGKIKFPKSETFEYKVGIAIRNHNDDGVDTYRIPGIATTNDGSLLAIYDARHDSSRDLQGDIDIALSRSVDKGESWEPMRTVLDMKEWGNLPQKFNGVSDANILVDRNSGKVFVTGLWMHGVHDKNGNWIENLNENSTEWNHQWRAKGSQPGFDVKQTCQTIISCSNDDGKSWSDPVNITSMCKKDNWWLFAPAPGSGITLNDGTLVFPSQGRNSIGTPFSTITYSKDGGKTWTTANPASFNTTECSVVQLSDNSLMLNIRDNRNRNNLVENGRSVYITKDLGHTWVEHSSSRNLLIEPTCMASLFNFECKIKNKRDNLLIFMNPNSKTSRNNMTIKISFDDGKTFAPEYFTLVDELPSRGYSSITRIDDKSIGVLFEGSQSDLVFMKFSIDELLK